MARADFLGTPSIGDHSTVHHPRSMAGLPTARARGLPKRLPKLRSSQSTEQNSEHLTELKTPANNSDDLTSTRCKAVYTGSIPVVASFLPANAALLYRQHVVSPARLAKGSPNGTEAVSTERARLTAQSATLAGSAQPLGAANRGRQHKSLYAVVEW
jgi:hypothetical protein